MAKKVDNIDDEQLQIFHKHASERIGYWKAKISGQNLIRFFNDSLGITEYLRIDKLYGTPFLQKSDVLDYKLKTIKDAFDNNSKVLEISKNDVSILATVKDKRELFSSDIGYEYELFQDCGAKGLLNLKAVLYNITEGKEMKIENNDEAFSNDLYEHFFWVLPLDVEKNYIGNIIHDLVLLELSRLKQDSEYVKTRLPALIQEFI